MGPVYLALLLVHAWDRCVLTAVDPDNQPCTTVAARYQLHCVQYTCQHKTYSNVLYRLQFSTMDIGP